MTDSFTRLPLHCFGRQAARAKEFRPWCVHDERIEESLWRAHQEFVKHNEGAHAQPDPRDNPSFVIIIVFNSTETFMKGI